MLVTNPNVVNYFGKMKEDQGMQYLKIHLPSQLCILETKNSIKTVIVRPQGSHTLRWRTLISLYLFEMGSLKIERTPLWKQIQ